MPDKDKELSPRQQQFRDTVTTLRDEHGVLLREEREGKIRNARENPGLIGDHLTSMRLHCNLLFSFTNELIDEENEKMLEVAKKRQSLYEAKIKEGKSESAAMNHAKEKTRVMEAELGVIRNKIRQIRDEYERFNGICMMLQSRMNEFNTERRMDG